MWRDETVFVRHPRARRYIIRVAANGGIRVTVPRGGSKRQARAFAEQQRPWVEKQRRQLALDRARAGQIIDPDVETTLRARSQTRVAGAVARTGSREQVACRQGVGTQSAVALGIVRAERSHLSELAPRSNAFGGQRLCDDPRAHAPGGAWTIPPGSGGSSRWRVQTTRTHAGGSASMRGLARLRPSTDSFATAILFRRNSRDARGILLPSPLCA